MWPRDGRHGIDVTGFEFVLSLAALVTGVLLEYETPALLNVSTRIQNTVIITRALD